MPPSRHIRLTDEGDVRLPQIEQAPYFKPKVRLRAQILRLSHRGYNIQATSAYTGRSGASIARDLERFKERGFEGLLDGGAPGNAPPITEEAGESMEEELPEDGTLNATQLAEALAEDLGVEVTPEAVGRHPRSMGYAWKRTRYVPTKPPDPEEEEEAREESEALQRGHSKGRSS